MVLQVFGVFPSEEGVFAQAVSQDRGAGPVGGIGLVVEGADLGTVLLGYAQETVGVVIPPNFLIAAAGALEVFAVIAAGQGFRG
ncbi:hypothetical protein [Actinoplanes sp. TFC3]|uniref:hypothetical protein n=1 Tax=Actinoplanes sp. TFC3 TaxID=1710355 RepID=UPI000832B2F6|nr:hypothetical protein [Actinoplanes sp. TFC3]